MRDILFRGKRVDNSEWVGGYFFAMPEHGVYFIELGGRRWIVDPETVGQYTGLKDKNGERIFEGDIVKTEKFGETSKWYIIKFDLRLGAFIGEEARRNMYFTTFDGDSDLFEVIGNVYDNEGLLDDNKM